MRHALSMLIAGALLLSGATGLRAQPNGAGNLQDAYKKEFAFLEAEKVALTKRLTEQEQSDKERQQAARGEIAGLQAKVVRVASEAERVEERVQAAERELETSQDAEGATEDILVRAEVAFNKAGLRMPSADVSKRPELIAQLELVFGKAPDLLAKQALVQERQGSYFDAAGKKISGPILHIGNISSYGLVEGASGPLAPAGEGRLQLWASKSGQAVAAQLAQGNQPNSLPLFLYESVETAVTPKVDKTVLDIIRTGGLIAWVIVALGCVALLMVFVRAWLLLGASRGGRLLAPILARIDRGKHSEALALARSSNSPTGRVLVATIGNLELEREQLEDVVAEAILQEQPRLSRFGASILVLASVSPLLGLLGTVTGMISTFDVITEFGTGNPKMLSGGISEALVTTELGLIVAIPALLLGHVLTGWSDAIRDTLDASALATLNRAAGIRPPEPEDRSLPVDESADESADDDSPGEDLAA